jgi:hypothetical protein
MTQRLQFALATVDISTMGIWYGLRNDSCHPAIDRTGTYRSLTKVNSPQRAARLDTAGDTLSLPFSPSISMN